MVQPTCLSRPFAFLPISTIMASVVQHARVLQAALERAAAGHAGPRGPRSAEQLRLLAQVAALLTVQAEAAAAAATPAPTPGPRYRLPAQAAATAGACRRLPAADATGPAGPDALPAPHPGLRRPDGRIYGCAHAAAPGDGRGRGLVGSRAGGPGHPATTSTAAGVLRGAGDASFSAPDSNPGALHSTEAGTPGEDVSLQPVVPAEVLS